MPIFLSADSIERREKRKGHGPCFNELMGCSNVKQHVEKRNNTRRSTIRKILRFQTHQRSNPTRPVSYAGRNEEHEISIRPLSMFDTVPFRNLEISKIIYLIKQNLFL